MAHRCGHPVAVICVADGTPAHFRWKGSEWPVAEVVETWHLMDRWWVRPTNPATATYSLADGEQDRTYYRVCCRGSAGEQVFDLYHDAVSNLWVLDVALRAARHEAGDSIWPGMPGLCLERWLIRIQQQQE